MKSLNWITLATALLFVSLPTRAQVYVDVIELEGNPFVWGLEWVNDTLYAGSTHPEEELLKVDYENETAESLFLLDFDPRGVAWDGTNWRISTGFESSDPEIFTFSRT